MRGPSLVLSALVMSCLAATAMAQRTSRIDRSFTVVGNDCSGVQWSPEALAQYPNIASACQSVETRDGTTFVRFQGTVERNINRGEQLTINFRDGSTMTLSPPENMQLFVNGRQTAVRDLRRGDQLNFRVPENQFVAQVVEDETPQTQFVVVPIVVRETVREPEQQAASLPHTAGDLPLVALGGVMLLGMGAGLTFLRKK